MKRILQWLRASRRRRTLVIGATTMAFIGTGVVVHLDEAHSFDLRTETFVFGSGGNRLDAVIHLPPGDGPHGVVVFVSGDGTADSDPGALPVWEALARSGYATVKWAKPGVGASTGNWLDQDMGDRATEVTDVLDALGDRVDLDLERVGVIGASQGGWVIPLVADRVEVDFFIAWSTAIDWAEQGAYLTEVALDAADASPELRERVNEADTAGETLVAAGTYGDYRRWYDALDADIAPFFAEMSRDRWGFAVRNHSLDVRETLGAMADTPVLLLLGGRDDNVDVDDTERVYREILGGPCLDVKTYPHADHSLLDHDGLRLDLTGIFRPRAIFADGLLDDLERYVAGPHDC